MANPTDRNDSGRGKSARTSREASGSKTKTAPERKGRKSGRGTPDEAAWFDVSETVLVEQIEQVEQMEQTQLPGNAAFSNAGQSDEDWPEPPHRSDIELDDDVTRQGIDINLGGRRMGGHTGGDLDGGGAGPAIGETHASEDATADHYGSREETQAALEEKIANLNTRQLRGRF